MKPTSTPHPKSKVGAIPQLDLGEDAVSGYLSAAALPMPPAPTVVGAQATTCALLDGNENKARPRFNLVLTDSEFVALKTIAKRESRTTSAQAAHFIRQAIRVTDVD
jgi:hypothetical protein